MSFTYYEDPILGKGRAQVDTGSGGSGGSSYVGGDRINIAGGTISFVNSADIVNVTGSSVTLQPDTAYKIYATSQAITLNANPPAAGKWAYEGHIELFVAGTGYVVTGANVVLANALEPDAVNNCTVRFHDGVAIIAVEDHIAGYIVVNGATSGDGSLAYGITTSTNDYVAFDASLNGTTIPLAGAVAEGEKHVVGNGYVETTLTGAVDCGTSKFTVANLGLSNVQVVGGVMTLGDAYIPSGSTVAVSGGGLAVEKVTGNGGVIDLGGTCVIVSSGATASVSGAAITNGAPVFNSRGGAFYNSGTLNLNGCTLTGNTANQGGAIFTSNGIGLNVISSVISGNLTSFRTGGISTDCLTVISESVVSGNQNSDIRLTGGTVTLVGSTVGVAEITDGTLIFSGLNRIDSAHGSNTSCSVTLTSSAILDLTGIGNPTPIAPGGAITFEDGVQIVTGGGTQTVITEVSGGTWSAIGNDTSLYALSAANYRIVGSATVTNAIIKAGNDSTYGCFVYSPSLTLSNCVLNMATSLTTDGTTYAHVYVSGTLEVKSYIMNANNVAGNTNTVLELMDNSVVDVTSSLAPPIGRNHPVGTVIVGEGVTFKNGESIVPITGGTYHKCSIAADGTITEA